MFFLDIFLTTQQGFFDGGPGFFLGIHLPLLLIVPVGHGSSGSGYYDFKNN